MAAHNAEIYGIPRDKLIFIKADALFVLGHCYKGGKLVYEHHGKGEECSERISGYRFGGLELLPPEIDATFLSPPWGGPEYETIGAQDFSLADYIKVYPCGDANLRGDNNCEDIAQDATDGEDLLRLAANASKGQQVIYFLPRNTNGVSLGRAAVRAGYQGSFEMEQNILANGKLKTITAYLGRDFCDLI